MFGFTVTGADVVVSTKVTTISKQASGGLLGDLFFCCNEGSLKMPTAISDMVYGTVVSSVVVAASMVDVSDPVIVAIGTAVMGGMGGAIKLLWDRNNKLASTTEIALAQCQDEHRATAKRYDTLMGQVVSLSSEVGNLTGRIQGFQEAEQRRCDKEAATEEHGNQM